MSVATREPDAFGDRHVRCGLAQTGSVDDLAFDPRPIRLPGDRFDHKAE